MTRRRFVGFPSTHTHSFEPWALVDRSSLTLASVCVLWSSSPQIYFHRYYTFPTPEPHVKTVEVVEGWIPDPHIYLCSRASAAFSLLWLHCSRFKNVQSSDSLWCCSSAPCVCVCVWWWRGFRRRKQLEEPGVAPALQPRSSFRRWHHCFDVW